MTNGACSGSGLGNRIIVRDRAGNQQLVRENVRIDTSGNVGIGTGQNNCSESGVDPGPESGHH